MPKTFTLTDEQRAILDAFETGGDIAAIAYAGASKTTILRLAAEETNRKMIVLAFNKAIAMEAAATFPSNAVCRTAHSFAYGAVGKHYRDRLNGPRVYAKATASILGITKTLDVSQDGIDSKLAPWALARMVMDTTRQFCYSADMQIDRKHVPYVPGADMDTLRDFIVPHARRAWDDLTAKTGRLGWNGSHDIYLKLWAMSDPILPADIVCQDEAQDANPCIAQVVQNQPAQKVMVGDPNQQIYAWRGAVDALSTFKADHRLPLSQSFRFGPAIADEANVWLQRLGNTIPLRGFDAIPSTVGAVDDPDAILCRTNAQVVAEAIQRIDADQRVAIVGGTGDIKRFAEGARDLQTGRTSSHPELLAFSTWGDVRTFVEQEDGGALKTMVKTIDVYGVDKVLEIADAAVSEDSADVVLSTAHKAKGREWDTVKIAGDFEPSDPDAQEPSRAEMMLNYVAVTRAKLTLDNFGLAWAAAL